MKSISLSIFGVIATFISADSSVAKMFSDGIDTARSCAQKYGQKVYTNEYDRSDCNFKCTNECVTPACDGAVTPRTEKLNGKSWPYDQKCQNWSCEVAAQQMCKLACHLDLSAIQAKLTKLGQLAADKSATVTVDELRKNVETILNSNDLSSKDSKDTTTEIH